MLELAILGLLKEQELHGYELKKRLAETVGSGISFGSLYPALNRLAAAGAVHVLIVPGDSMAVPGDGSGRRAAKPATGGSRGKKVYGITEHGDHLFDQLLAAETATSEDERSFNLRLAFARHLPRDARIGMMERRRSFLLERLARTKITIRIGWGRLDAYTRSLMEHGNETTERDIFWLDRLIARERAESRPPHDDAAALAARGAADQATGAGSTESAALALASWAASTAPTMPARPQPAHPANPMSRVPTTPPTPNKHGPASPAQGNEGRPRWPPFSTGRPLRPPTSSRLRRPISAEATLS